MLVGLDRVPLLQRVINCRSHLVHVGTIPQLLGIVQVLKVGEELLYLLVVLTLDKGTSLIPTRSFFDINAVIVKCLQVGCRLRYQSLISEVGRLVVRSIFVQLTLELEFEITVKLGNRHEVLLGSHDYGVGFLGFELSCGGRSRRLIRSSYVIVHLV